MKHHLFVMVALFISSCVPRNMEDVSHEYLGLVGETFTLKCDAYIVRYYDETDRLFMVPCLPYFASMLPTDLYEFDKDLIGKSIEDVEFVNFLKRGENIKIVSVIKIKSFSMGEIISPVIACKFTENQTVIVHAPLLFELTSPEPQNDHKIINTNIVKSN